MDEPMVDPEFDEEVMEDEVGDVVDPPNPSTYEVGGPSTAIAAQPQVIDDLYREMDKLRGAGAGNAGGPERVQQARGCTFSSFMKCGPTQFHGKEGAIELCHWFEKMECTFGISECAERNKVKFAAATL
ncbi:hypothetical protein Tco_0863246, partial [Tanacetum coccineum]